MNKMTKFFPCLLAACVLCGGVKAAAQGPDDYGSLADGIQKLIDKAQEDVNRLQKELDSEKAKSEKLARELDEAKSGRASAEKALEERESRVKTLSDQLAGRDKECAREKAALEKENKHLKAQLDRIKEIYASYTVKK